jgi:undecaprenyl-diphosphatase
MDQALFHAINGLAGHIDGVDDGFELFSKLVPIAMLAMVAALWFWPGSRDDRDRREWGVIAACAGAASALAINQIIIRLWDRPRPFVSHHATMLLAPSHDPSFPSDHATFGFAMAVGILFASRRLGIVALVLAAMMAFSRVYTGEHYVSDVVFGAMVGSVMAIAVYRMRPLLTPIVDPALQLARRYHLA